MFDKIQHIGYLVADLDAAVDWFQQGFGAANAGGSTLAPGAIGTSIRHGPPTPVNTLRIPVRNAILPVSRL